MYNILYLYRISVFFHYLQDLTPAPLSNGIYDQNNGISTRIRFIVDFIFFLLPNRAGGHRAENFPVTVAMLTFAFLDFRTTTFTRLVIDGC